VERDQENEEISKRREKFQERQRQARIRDERITKMRLEKAEDNDHRWQMKLTQIENVQRQKEAIEKVFYSFALSLLAFVDKPSEDLFDTSILFVIVGPC
jgi:hypothetical protein